LKYETSHDYFLYTQENKFYLCFISALLRELKTTPFTHFHEQLGAKMAEFAGYNMPIVYSSITEKAELLTI